MLETSAVTPSVPEPSTWVLMIVGFGLVAGFAGRRRAWVASRRGSATVPVKGPTEPFSPIAY